MHETQNDCEACKTLNSARIIHPKAKKVWIYILEKQPTFRDACLSYPNLWLWSLKFKLEISQEQTRDISSPSQNPEMKSCMKLKNDFESTTSFLMYKHSVEMWGRQEASVKFEWILILSKQTNLSLAVSTSYESNY